MKKLSVVLITFNEEDRLAEALISCKDIADEIIVVDCFSTDKTCDIAAQYGAKIVKHKFIDFGSQKNVALDQAKNDWVLNLDADERVSDLLKGEIRKFKKMEDTSADGFYLNRKTYYLNRWIKHSGWYPDRKLRLFKKSKSRWKGRIHEALILDGESSRMKGDILHYTYRNISDHINRLNKYSEIQAEDIVDKGKKLLYLRFLLLPPVTFIRFYIWKLGFLDGLPGFVIALVSSWATAMKYMKAIENRRTEKQKLR
jgi:glycosyltransferase involved in cell wall biosynthesis